MYGCIKKVINTQRWSALPSLAASSVLGGGQKNIHYVRPRLLVLWGSMPHPTSFTFSSLILFMWVRFHSRDQNRDNCCYAAIFVHRYCKQIDCVLWKKMVLCLIVGCRNRSGRDKRLYFAKVSSIIENQGKDARELSEERRSRWISAISRDDLTDTILENDRVCVWDTLFLERPQNHGINLTSSFLAYSERGVWIPTSGLALNFASAAVVFIFKSRNCWCGLYLHMYYHPGLYTNMANGNNVTSRENDLFAKPYW